MTNVNLETAVKTLKASQNIAAFNAALPNVSEALTKVDKDVSSRTCKDVSELLFMWYSGQKSNISIYSDNPAIKIPQTAHDALTFSGERIKAFKAICMKYYPNIYTTGFPDLRAGLGLSIALLITAAAGLTNKFSAKNTQSAPHA